MWCGLSLIFFFIVINSFVNHLDYIGFITLAFILRITNGIGAASFQVTSYITVAGIFPNNIASAFGSMETAVGLGYIVGPALGGFLYELGGFPTPFIVIGGIILSLSFISIFAIPKREPDGSSMSLMSMVKFTLNFGVALSILAILTNEFNTGYLSATLEPFLRHKFSLRPVFVGLVFMAQGACYALTTPVWGYLTDKGVGTAVSCLVGCIICFVGCVFLGPLPFFPFEPKLWLVILSLILCGLGIAAKMVCAFTGMLHYAQKNGYTLDKNTYALTSAIFNSACALGASVGPFIGGAFLDNYNFRTGSYLLAAMDLALAVLYVIEIIRSKPHSAITRSLSKDACESEEMVAL